MFGGCVFAFLFLFVFFLYTAVVHFTEKIIYHLTLPFNTSFDFSSFAIALESTLASVSDFFRDADNSAFSFASASASFFSESKSVFFVKLI